MIENIGSDKMLLSDKNAGLILATMGSAIVGSMVQVISTDQRVRITMLVVAMIMIIWGTRLYEKG